MTKYYKYKQIKKYILEDNYHKIEKYLNQASPEEREYILSREENDVILFDLSKSVKVAQLIVNYGNQYPIGLPSSLRVEKNKYDLFYHSLYKEKVCARLIQNGLYIDDEQIMELIKNDCLICFEVLKETGKDLNRLIKDNRSILAWAIEKNKNRLVKFLVENNCNPLLETTKTVIKIGSEQKGAKNLRKNAITTTVISCNTEALEIIIKNSLTAGNLRIYKEEIKKEYPSGYMEKEVSSCLNIIDKQLRVLEEKEKMENSVVKVSTEKKKFKNKI